MYWDLNNQFKINLPIVHQLIDRSSHRRCYLKKVFSENFARFTGKTSVPESLFLIKLQVATLLKKQLWHMSTFFHNTTGLLYWFAVQVKYVVSINMKDLETCGTFINNCVEKMLEKLRKLRKSCNHKWNINRIYNEKLRYYCAQQLPTVRLKILGN